MAWKGLGGQSAPILPAYNWASADWHPKAMGQFYEQENHSRTVIVKLAIRNLDKMRGLDRTRNEKSGWFYYAQPCYTQACHRRVGSNMSADFGLGAFKQSAMGRRVGPILMHSENVRDMIALCRHDIAAVRAVGKQLLALGLRPKNETEKKHIGRWIREIMGTAGWEPVRSGKLPRGNLFSTGAIYKPRPKLKD